MKHGTDYAKVLKKLVTYFARFGLPDVLVSDNGPPFNSWNFVDFLQKQGIKVMKSPPYNPSSNGQAERLVRTVKEVLKRFLMDPKMMELDLEDQINLFLFNFRNNNLTKDGCFPSERIFSYKPKTILDLVNPKNHYKKHMYKPQPDDANQTEQQSGKVPKTSEDALDKLIAGDEVWYKNHNPQIHARWIKAIFIKKHSNNIFQISIGSVVAMAHRTQIRICKEDSTGQGPNVWVTLRQQHGRHQDPPSLIIPDVEPPPRTEDGRTQTPRGARKRMHPIPVDDVVELRRSKRSKKSNRRDEYHYN